MTNMLYVCCKNKNLKITYFDTKKVSIKNKI